MIANVASNSRTVGVWTAFSRLTGVGRVLVIGAVLGPTFFGNLYQGALLLPRILNDLVLGQLIASLLVPRLVRAIDSGEPDGANRLARGFLGVVLAVFSAAAIVITLAGPVVLQLLGAGLDSAAMREAQLRLGWPLLAVVVPQVVLYGFIATAVAVQNGHGRFGLASSAPAIENVGIIATVVIYASVFGTRTSLVDANLGHVVLLGVGATLSVGLHAAVQWWGAAQCGVRLVPAPGWADDDVRQIIRLAQPSLGWAALNSLRSFVMVVVAGTVAGGVVAFQLAQNVLQTVVALGANSVATAVLPVLSRHWAARRYVEFRLEYERGINLALFVLAPASMTIVALSDVLADAASFGEMRVGGVDLVAASLIGTGAGIVGMGVLWIATHGTFARLDARSALRSMQVNAAVFGCGAVVAMLVGSGASRLLLLGLAVAAGDLAASGLLVRRLVAHLPRCPDPLVTRQRIQTILIAAIAALVGLGVARIVDEDIAGRFGTLACAFAMAIPVYLALQRRVGSPELAGLLARPAWEGRSDPTGGETIDPLDRMEASASPAPVTDRSRLIAAAAIGLLAAGMGSFAALHGGLGVAVAVLGVGTLVGFASRPVWIAYAILGVTPLIVGIDRGAILPLLRPNEALVLALLGALAARVLLDPEWIRLRVHAVDGVLVALAFFASIPPLLWLVVRGRPVLLDDYLHALQLWKYVAMYGAFRLTVRTDRDVKRCLWLSLFVGSIVAALGVLQAMQVGIVIDFLERYYGTLTPEDLTRAVGRGSSTMSSSISLASYLPLNLAIALAMYLRGVHPRPLLAAFIAIFTLGTLGTGQFTGIVALGAVAVTMAVVHGRTTELVRRGGPLVAVSAVLTWPIIRTRLDGFQSPDGLPESWVGRWDNLTRFVWPELQGTNLVFGVRPSYRIPAPEIWREWIFIESGHSWLLWVGGIPLLLCFFVFVVVSFRTFRRRLSETAGSGAAAVDAALAAVVSLSALMVLDPHLTMRGSADLLYPMFALALAAPAAVSITTIQPTTIQPTAEREPVLA